MNRIVRGLALAAGCLAFAPAALAADGDGKKTDVERRLEEVLAELDAQRIEIDALKAQLAKVQPSTLAAEVARYLEEEGQAKKDPLEFRSFWKDGLAFENADRSFTLKVGGRFQYDFVFPSTSEGVETARGDYDPMSGFRRLRVELEGTVYENVYYKTSIEFAEAAYAYRENYFGLKGLPAVGNLQVGFMKEPVSLEELTSDLYTTFIERGLPNALAPSYDHGVMLFNAYEDGRFCWWAGDFWDGPGSPAPIQHNLTARITGAPILDRESSTLLHLGASVSDRSPESETDQFRARPEAPFVPRLVDTGVFGVDSERIVGLEGAFVRGPFSVQGEWLQVSCDDHPDAPGPSPTFRGWYAFVSWFATGESRPYRNGAFQRIRPKSNFDGKGGGWGALEVAARYSVLDLDDDGIAGGVADDVTLGANWYLNPSAHVSANYVWSDRHDLGRVRSFVLRFQVDF